jgi:hypothetical protein
VTPAQAEDLVRHDLGRITDAHAATARTVEIPKPSLWTT